MGETIILDGDRIYDERQKTWRKMREATNIRGAYYPPGAVEQHNRALEAMEKRTSKVVKQWGGSAFQSAFNKKFHQKIGEFTESSVAKQLETKGSRLPGRLKIMYNIGEKTKIGILDPVVSTKNIWEAKDRSKALVTELTGEGGGRIGSLIGGSVGAFFGPGGITAGQFLGGIIGSYYASQWVENGQYDIMKKNMLQQGRKTATSNYYAFGDWNTNIIGNYGSNYDISRMKKEAEQKLWKGKEKRTRRLLNNASAQRLHSRKEREKKTKEVNKFIKNFSLVKKPFYYAEGGIVKQATFGYVGEEGPEVIIPISQKRRQRGLELWEKAGEKLGISKKGRKQINRYTKDETIDLLKLLQEQRGEVSDEICTIVAEGLESAYQNIPMVL